MASSRLAALATHLIPGTAQTANLAGPLLQSQVAIITGSAQGIGRSAALLFAAHGAKVVVSDLDANKANAVVKEITDAGGEAIAFAGNVMDKDFGDKCVKATVDKFGKINHLILNAGFTDDKMLHNMTDEQFQLMLDCHTIAPFRLIRAAAPYFRIKDKNQRENRSVVFVSSTSGTHGNTGQMNYAAAKSSVIGMTKTLAKEWGPFGVRSNAVAYGWIQTRLTAAKENGETIEIGGKKVALGIPGRKGGAEPSVNAVADIPLQRPGEPLEAGAALLFLASPLASYLTGTITELTGGRGI